MNSNPMGGLWLLVLVVLAVFAVAGAKGAKWKVLNSAIIMAFMVAGLAVGAGLGAWGGNMEIGGHAAASLMILLGAVGALGCIRRDKRRKNQIATAPFSTDQDIQPKAQVK